MENASEHRDDTRRHLHVLQCTSFVEVTILDYVNFWNRPVDFVVWTVAWFIPTDLIDEQHYIRSAIAAS